jgi:hypothetical protein
VPDPGGPHLQTALFCERVLQERDGVVSAIRVIDRVFFRTDPDGQPITRQHPITLLITFKAGSARGSYTVKVEREKPSGERAPVLQAPVFFEGEERGVNLVVDTAFEPDQQGLYWFDVFFEDARVTRIPLRAIYQQLPTADPGG